MKAKHIVAILLIACLMSSNTFALAENFDPSRYDTQTLINMQAAINAEIANRQVSAASSLIPAPGFDGEIKFRNLEWGIDADSIIKQLTSEGVFSPKPSIANTSMVNSIFAGQQRKRHQPSTRLMPSALMVICSEYPSQPS